ncbi:uncharacterized protein AMSG_06207 [Thecamonas trahens ATCC 50062]|uniref:PDZ domain-containing protein n=1 Tax=Thecamonas trahens ATCC 50062 TaxID=461836 RepID=A0A0L0DCQ7_THETB|nr:hypothetical protein AMSG_06207 [Thecamonas trahens ATCC 50062]KNC49906.1 hypothetical protein AMSG_06207 [Thecamonas trahens ATCC 50062]|eukprot:XP_013757387.1 hypothetical protein AMSG_06207 [Thecamonas trahens ATCC 50062]
MSWPTLIALPLGLPAPAGPGLRSPSRSRVPGGLRSHLVLSPQPLGAGARRVLPPVPAAGREPGPGDGNAVVPDHAALDALAEAFELVLVDGAGKPVASSTAAARVAGRSAGGRPLTSGHDALVVVAAESAHHPVHSATQALDLAGLGVSGAVELWTGASFDGEAFAAHATASRHALESHGRGGHSVLAFVPPAHVDAFATRYEYLKNRVGLAVIELVTKLSSRSVASEIRLDKVVVELGIRERDAFAGRGLSEGLGDISIEEELVRKAELREALLAEQKAEKARREMLFQKELERARSEKKELVRATEEHALLALSMSENADLKQRLAAVEKINSDLEQLSSSVAGEAERNRELMEQWYDAFAHHQELLEKAKDEKKRSVALEKQRAERERMELKLKALKERTDAQRALARAKEEQRERTAEVRRIAAEKARIEAEKREAEKRAEVQRRKLERQLELELEAKSQLSTSMTRTVGRVFKLAQDDLKLRKKSEERSTELAAAMQAEKERKLEIEARMAAYQEEIVQRDDAREQLLQLKVEIGIAVTNHNYVKKRHGPQGELIKDVTKAVKIVSVHEGGPAEIAGLRAGDIVLKAGNIEVVDRTAFLHVQHAAFVGETEIFRVIRKGTPLNIRVQYGAVGKTLDEVIELRDRAGEAWCEARDSAIDDVSDLGRQLLMLQQSHDQ